MLELGVISLFPEIFECLKFGITGRILKNNLARINFYNPRNWTKNPYKKVDDKPYGGGPGMVMLYQPLKDAIAQAKKDLPTNCKIIYLSPQGRKISQSDLNDLVVNKQAIIFVAGRYEGLDERIITKYIDEEWSIGDFVLNGGEFAALVFIEAILRLLPQALGDPQSVMRDSFMQTILEHPQYTRPDEIDGMKVPLELLNGNHQVINRWRRKYALGNTWLKRPDLLAKLELSIDDLNLLAEFKNEYKQEVTNKFP